MQIEDLKIRSEQIDNLVHEQIHASEGELYPVTDGIVDIGKYIHSKYKIMWILKEPIADDFDENGLPEGGGWDLKKVVRDKKSINDFEKGRKAFENVTYTTWSILNDFCLWEQMPDLSTDNSVLEALKCIAYINVKKLPGKAKSVDYIIGYAYNDYKHILLKQIADYEPDIIIGGNTLWHFFADLGILKKDMLKNNNVDYIIKNGKLFIDAYHPSQFKISPKQYCNDIVETAKIWAKTK